MIKINRKFLKENDKINRCSSTCLKILEKPSIISKYNLILNEESNVIEYLVEEDLLDSLLNELNSRKKGDRTYFKKGYNKQFLNGGYNE